MKKINLLAMMLFVILLAILLTVLFVLYRLISSPLITQQDMDHFEDIGDILNSNDPAVLFKRVRGLLDKYDKPEVLEHAAKVMSMDPGELARMQLKI